MSKKAVVVTGCSGGIGTSLVKTFQESNFDVIGLDIVEFDNEIDHFINTNLNKYCIDSNYRNEINEKIFAFTTDIEVLVNNAAVQILSSFIKLSIDDWNKSLNVNLSAPMLLSQSLSFCLEKNKGCIINIASIHGKLTKPKFVSYATSKSALIGLTKAMAVDLEGRIRVNSISPAAIYTKMLLDGFNNDETKVQLLNSIHPSKKIGRPEEVANLALMLASKKLSFLNGSNIELDGAISSVLKDLQ